MTANPVNQPAAATHNTVLNGQGRILNAFDPKRLVTMIALILTGLSAGFFYTYEVSVTRGLALVDDVTYVQTFQAINATIRHSGFGLIFFGPMPAIAAAIFVNWKTSNKVVRGLLVSGLVLYVTCVLITFVGNVPLNNELAQLTVVTPESARSARLAFENEWNLLDWWRTLAVITSFVAMAAASFGGRSPRAELNRRVDDAETR